MQAAARADKETKAAEAKAAKDSEMESRAAAKAEQARCLVITPRTAAKAEQALYLAITPRGGGEGGSDGVTRSSPESPYPNPVLTLP